MRVLFIHNNYPAQFGHVADALNGSGEFDCTFLSRRAPDIRNGMERMQYAIAARGKVSGHSSSRDFERCSLHSAGILRALRERPDVKPDVIVAHSGFFHSAFLRELYDCPIVAYFEYYFRAGGDWCFRSDLPGAVDSVIAKNMQRHSHNASILLDLESCDAGYSPFEWQRDRLPIEFHSKVDVIFDGVDTDIWKPVDSPARQVGERVIPADTLVVTYVARGLEPIRGFDVFMKFAKELGAIRSDVVFVVVGRDKIHYGADTRFLDGRTFKEWVLARDDYDLERFVFVDWMETADLVDLFSLSDLHVYLTAPFVLSWSLVNAMSCGAAILASDEGPVSEVIRDGETGALVPFFDVDAMVERATALLDDPDLRDQIGARARRKSRTI